MEVFVLRHGHAEPQQTTDEARHLTEKGRADVAVSVTSSRIEMREIKEIWSSSLVRAQETAHIARDILFGKDSGFTIKTTDFVTPESDPNAFFDELQKANLPSVLIVSHQPFIGKFLDRFCGTPLGTHTLDTSALALVECDVVAQACGNLRWLRQIHG